MPRAVHAVTLDVSSLALSSTMMSCTVHSLMDSLMQPSCIVVYILCNPAPGGSPFKLSLGLCSKLLSPISSPPSEFVCVLVLGSWSFGLGSPQICSLWPRLFLHSVPPDGSPSGCVQIANKNLCLVQGNTCGALVQK